MKKRILAAVFVLLTASTLLQAQQSDQPKIKCAGVRNFYFHIGLNTIHEMNGNLADFRSLAPKSDLLNTDLTGFGTYGGRSISSNSVFSVAMGLKFANKDHSAFRGNPELRLGLSYYTGGGFSGNLFNETRQAYDTLISAQTGTAYYVDSVDAKNYNMDYTFDQLRLDASLIFRTDPTARWSLFAGVGMSAGMSIHAQTEVSYSRMRYTDTKFSDFGSYSNFPGNDNFQSESFRNKSNIGFSAYIPMGIDFRMGNKKAFWKRTHLYYEMGPGINFTVIPELRTITTMSIRHGFGLRVSLD